MTVGIVFFPGLKGDKQFKPDYPARTHKGYAELLKEVAANFEGVEFVQAEYQSAEDPCPLISDMGEKAKNALHEISERHDNVIVVGSSVGAGAFLEGFGNYESLGGKQPLAVVFISPVYDPIRKVEQLAGKQVVQMLKDGKIPAIPVDVSSAEGQADPGKFYMTKAHMEDPCATRVLKALDHPFGNDGFNHYVFIDRTTTALRHFKTPVQIFTAEDDKLSSPQEADEFLFDALNIRDPKRMTIKIWEGGHNTKAESRFNDVAACVSQMIETVSLAPKRPSVTAKPSALDVPEA